jgi:hypothetical protein
LAHVPLVQTSPWQQAWPAPPHCAQAPVPSHANPDVQ